MLRSPAAALAVLVAAPLAAAGTAAAQPYIIEGNAAVNLGYTQTSQGTFQPDPNAEPIDVPDDLLGTFFTELRPGGFIQRGSPRLSWRVGYQFSGNLRLAGSSAAAYSNQANLALIGVPSKYTQLTLDGSIAQGGTSYLLGQRPAESGQPDFRAPGNPNIISITAGESLSWQAGRATQLQQNLSAAMNAPQDAFDQYNASIGGTLALERQYRTDAAGLELRSNLSWLRPQQAGIRPYASITNGVSVRWNRDHSYRWNTVVSAGVEQVYSDTGSEPLAFLPAGSASARYTYRNTVAALDVSHGSATNLQVGTVTLADRLTARGVITLDPVKLRTFSFSAGVLYNQPLGSADALAAGGTGTALQGDAGYTTQLAKNLIFTARYTIAYQFGQGGSLPSTLAHVALVGVTARYSNSERLTRPMPTRGRRVDGSDGRPFVDALPEGLEGAGGAGMPLP